MGDEDAWWQRLAVGPRIRDQQQILKACFLEGEIALVAPPVLHRLQELVLIIPHRLDYGIALGNAIGQGCRHLAELRIIHELLHRIDHGGVDALGCKHRRRDGIKRQAAGLQLGAVMQVALLHIHGERQIGPRIADRGPLHDPAQQIR
jgi:hypothetical protein